MRARNYCFTYHLTEEEQKNGTTYDQFVRPLDHLRGAIWQLESCPSSGRKHLQGYIEYNSPLRIAAVKRHLGERVHLEPRRGTREQAIAYCEKEETRVEGPWRAGDLGQFQPGKRTDLDNVAEAITSGKELSSIVEEFPVSYIKYRRGIEALYARVSRPSRMAWREVSVLVYYGAAGTGKTRSAIEESGEDFYILDQGERLWFDGYEGQRNLIIDDFYGWIKWGTLLRILDGHPYRCEIKGSFVWAAWTRVFITSNQPPSSWYPTVSDPQLRRALERRISTEREFRLES